MTHSVRLKPFMAYLDVAQYAEVKRFSKRVNIPMSQLVREALTARLSSGDQFTAGFNAGLKAAMKAVSEHDASRMRFPSGKSFEELINTEIKKEFLNGEVEQ